MNYYILTILLALFTAQTIKFIIESIRSKKFKFARWVNGSGGMPSSHTTVVSSISTIVAMTEGIESLLFAVCVAFSLIVAYDAMGLRKESGKQAAAINVLFNDLVERPNKEKYKKLKEELGHNPSEVLAGLIFGSVFTIIVLQLFI